MLLIVFLISSVCSALLDFLLKGLAGMPPLAPSVTAPSVTDSAMRGDDKAEGELAADAVAMLVPTTVSMNGSVMFMGTVVFMVMLSSSTDSRPPGDRLLPTLVDDSRTGPGGAAYVPRVRGVGARGFLIFDTGLEGGLLFVHPVNTLFAVEDGLLGIEKAGAPDWLRCLEDGEPIAVWPRFVERGRYAGGPGTVLRGDINRGVLAIELLGLVALPLST